MLVIQALCRQAAPASSLVQSGRRSRRLSVGMRKIFDPTLDSTIPSSRSTPLERAKNTYLMRTAGNDVNNSRRHCNSPESMHMCSRVQRRGVLTLGAVERSEKAGHQTTRMMDGHRWSLKHHAGRIGPCNRIGSVHCRDGSLCQPGA